MTNTPSRVTTVRAPAFLAERKCEPGKLRADIQIGWAARNVESGVTFTFRPLVLRAVPSWRIG